MLRFLQQRLSWLDFGSWLLVILFFGVATLIFKGILHATLAGAMGIVFLMLLITLSINIILDGMRCHPRAGEIAGYITNGPEALCVLVGLLNHKLLLAISVPVGSNFINPLLFALAMGLGHQGRELFRKPAMLAGLLLLLTVISAGAFYLSPSSAYRWGWCAATLLVSVFLYRMRGDEHAEEQDEVIRPEQPWLIVPAVLVLIAAGYFLDPVVSYTAASSRVPEGMIGFFVLSLMSSWPEFRGTLGLIERQRLQSAFIAIYISNITNLWLAVGGTLLFLLLG